MKPHIAPMRWVAAEDLVEQRKRMRHAHDAVLLPCGYPCSVEEEIRKSTEEGRGELAGRNAPVAADTRADKPMDAPSSPRAQTVASEGAGPRPDSAFNVKSVGQQLCGKECGGWCSYTLGTRLSGEDRQGKIARDMVSDALTANGFSVASQSDLTDAQGNSYAVIGATFPEFSQKAMLLDPCTSTILSVTNIVIRKIKRGASEASDATEVLVMDPTLALRISCHRAMPELAVEYRARLIAFIRTLDVAGGKGSAHGSAPSSPGLKRARPDSELEPIPNPV
uniref:Uncharacterized protein n=1 Tax=Hemiselmis tepida TaxID=464990 RepID=A0A7S0VU30_9CRYP|mmetsp:Transcript_21203/g.53344  ORF Transcript_21203/g.53344 Transcript_21203/m.53344 type:complete len:280 (+) Transcript_21203:66-905(+)